MKCYPFYYNIWKKGQWKSSKASSSLPTFSGNEVISNASEFSQLDASNTSTDASGPVQLPEKSSNLKPFTFSELKQATRNFSRTTKLGEGGFGCVFKGVIKSTEDPTRKMDVAVKQLSKGGMQGHKEWVTEVNVLGIAEHPNLVKLIGYCAEDDERGIQRLLVYEYMPNGSVEDHLSSRAISPLSWTMRLKIALDAASGLAYLHEEMGFQIIFRDFKTSNVLLDEQWKAKLSDFGLARLGPSEGVTHVTTAVVGTLGYAAPEYVQTGHLTVKSDIWSYGVFLYELITGRRPLEHHRPKSEQKLVEWVKPYLSDPKKFQHIIDPRLEKQHILRSAHKLSIVANRCMRRHPKSRPKMSEVRDMVREVIVASMCERIPRHPLGYKEPEGAFHRSSGKRGRAHSKTVDGCLLFVFGKSHSKLANQTRYPEEANSDPQYRRRRV